MGHGAGRRIGAHASGATAVLAAAALALSGCFQAQRELDVGGVHVELDAAAASTGFASAPDFPARLERMMRIGARYWSGSDDLAPWRTWDLRFEGTAFNCGSLEGRALGCTDQANHVMAVSTKDPSSYLYKWPVPCVEVTEVIHEMGHALIGDGDHRDRRWRRFDALYHDVLFDDEGLVDKSCQYHGWTAHGGYAGEWDG